MMETTVDKEEFFRQPNVAILATTGPGQRPHAMPVWYLYQEPHFIISAGETSQKVLNIKRQREATLVIDRRDPPYYAVMIQGTATLGPSMSDDMRLRLCIRYLGEEKGRAYAPVLEKSSSIAIYLQPVRVIEYHGTAGRSDYC